MMQFLAPRIGVDGVVFLAMLLLLGTLPCIRGLARWAEARHGRFVLPPGDPESLVNWEAVGAMSGTVVLMMAVHNAPAIAKAGSQSA